MIDVLKSLIKQFMPFAQEKMGFDRPPKLFLRQDRENAANPLGKTGFYDPQAESVTLYVTGRHPKDIMRSLAHELQHHTQKCNGDFESVQNMGEEGYAQADPHMRTMEIQAYQASIVFRDWEDSTKGTIYYEHLQKGDNVSMSTKNWKNGELKSLLSEAWGFKMDLSKLNEGAGDAAVRKRCGEDGSGCTAEEAQDIYNKAEHGSGEAGHDERGSLEEESQLDEYSGSGVNRGPDDKDPTKPEGEDQSKREKEEIEDVKEGCGDHADDGGMEMMVVDDEMDPESQMGGESDVEGLAHELLSLASRIGDALGVDSEVSSMGDDDEEDLEEDRSRGRDAPNVRGKEGKHNLRPEGKKISEAQVRRIVAKVLKERRKKGK